MLIADITAEVRDALNDTDADHYHWTDFTMRRYLNDAVQVIVARRPELRHDTNGNLTTFGTITADTATVDLDASVRPAVVAYICYRALGEDEADRKNTEAAAVHYQSFERALYGA